MKKLAIVCCAILADQNKASDSLMKIALSREKTGDLAFTRRTPEEVLQQDRYAAAASAKSELKRIKY